MYIGIASATGVNIFPSVGRVGGIGQVEKQGVAASDIAAVEIQESLGRIDVQGVDRFQLVGDRPIPVVVVIIDVCGKLRKVDDGQASATFRCYISEIVVSLDLTPNGIGAGNSKTNYRIVGIGNVDDRKAEICSDQGIFVSIMVYITSDVGQCGGAVRQIRT